MAFRGILPEVPSFGQQLARGLGAGIGAGTAQFGDTLQKMMLENAKAGRENEAIQRLTGQDVSGLSGDLRKEFLKNFQKNQKKETQSNAALQTQFNHLVDLTKDLGFAVGPPSISPTKGRERADFESSKTSLVSGLRDLVNKGVLTNQKFQYILGQIPDHGDRKEVKIGKLEGIAGALGLDPSYLLQSFPKEEGSSKSKGSSKSAKSKFDKSNPEHMKKFEQVKKDVGADKEEVRKILEREFEL